LFGIFSIVAIFASVVKKLGHPVTEGGPVRLFYQQGFAAKCSKTVTNDLRRIVQICAELCRIAQNVANVANL
jgi:hypothetical protein